jgi:hypothetical protein
MANIYDGCIDNSEIICVAGTSEFYLKLEQKSEEAKRNNKKIVFVEGFNSVLSSARIVLYDKPIPEIMQNYKYRIVKFNGIWVRNGLLGYCDKCNDYAELTCLCEEGHTCNKGSKFYW